MILSLMICCRIYEATCHLPGDLARNTLCLMLKHFLWKFGKKKLVIDQLFLYLALAKITL